MNASKRSRKRRAKTGEVPAVETATSTGSRSMIAGTMNRDASRSSTTFTGMARASLKLAIQRFTARRDVATITRRAPSKSPGNEFANFELQLAGRGPILESGAICGATSVIRRTGALEQAHLAQRHLAAADDEHLLALEIEEKGKVIQRLSPRRMLPLRLAQIEPTDQFALVLG